MRRLYKYTVFSDLSSMFSSSQAVSTLPQSGAHHALLSGLWTAGARPEALVGSATARPTGHALLDAELPGGGWPSAGLTELLTPEPASGEWSLLVSSLRPTEPAFDVLCVAPPYLLHAPAFSASGLPLQRLLVVRPGTFADAVWSVEQGLRSGACAAVVWWQSGTAPDAKSQRDEAMRTALRRLHWAAREAGRPLFAIRPLACKAQSSPAPLRLLLAPAPDERLGVTVFKRRGPPMDAPLWLHLPVRRHGVRSPASSVAVPQPSSQVKTETLDAVAGAAPERIAA